MEDKMIITKGRSDTKSISEICSPIVSLVMSDCHSFEDEETIKLILDLRQKTELRFGEIVLLLLHDSKPQVSSGYFKVLYYAARNLEPLYDYFTQDITLEELDKMLESSSESKKCRCKSILKRAIEYFENTGNENPYMVLKRKHYKIRKLDMLYSEDQDFTKVQSIMLDYHSFESEEIIQYIEKMQRKKDLKFGEALLLILIYKKLKVKHNYFLVLFYAAGELEPLYEINLCEIDEDDVNKLIGNLSAHNKRFCYSLYRQVRDSSYNTNNEDHKLKDNWYYDPFQKRQSFKSYDSTISFQQNYEPPANVRFETFFKYWIFSHKDYYSSGFFRSCYAAYTKLDTLRSRPFKLIRCSDITRRIQGLTLNQKNSVILLYRLLDKFAYEKEIIQKRYAINLHLYVVKSNNTKVFLEEDVQELLKHRGEIIVDITLVLLFTGIALKEISNINQSNYDKNSLHIREGDNKSSIRSIPIHRDIKRSMQNVIKFMESLNTKGISNSNQKSYIKEMIIDATEKYCSKKYTPVDCRRSFTNQLLSTGSSRATIENLRGTQHHLLRLYERVYIHQSLDRLSEAINNLTWGGGYCDEYLSDAI